MNTWLEDLILDSFHKYIWEIFFWSAGSKEPEAKPFFLHSGCVVFHCTEAT